MKGPFASILVIACLVGLSWSQDPRTLCNKFPKLFECNGMITDAKADFCQQLSKIRDCFEKEAECKKEFFDSLQETTEKGLGVKCAACAFVPTTTIVIMLTAALIMGRSYLSSDQKI